MGDYNGVGGRGGNRGGGGGYKRRRDEPPPLPPIKLLLQTLIYLGDDALHQTGSLSLPEEALTAAVQQAKREARGDPESVTAMLLDCAVHLSTKQPLYALLVGASPAAAGPAAAARRGAPTPTSQLMLHMLS